MSDHLFSGLKVIDCASWIAGPAAATIMSDFGADVIKIEPPGVGDPWRAPQRQPGATERLLLAADVAQQTQPGAGPEARGRPRRAVSAGRRRRCVRHQLSAAGARSPEAGADGSAAAEPAADLRVVHRLWRGGRGGGEDRLRLHRLLGAHRPDGRGACRCGHAAGAVGARHGRSSQRHRPVRRHRHRAVPPREDRHAAAWCVRRCCRTACGPMAASCRPDCSASRCRIVRRASRRRTRSPTTIAAATAAGSSWRCSTRSGSCARCSTRSAARTWPTIRASPRKEARKQNAARAGRRTGRRVRHARHGGMAHDPRRRRRDVRRGRQDRRCGGRCADAGDRRAGAVRRWQDADGVQPFHLDGEAKVAPRRAPAVGQHSEDVLREAGYSADDIGRLRKLGVLA